MLNNAEIAIAIPVGLIATIALLRLDGGYLRLIAATLAVSAWGTLAWSALAPATLFPWGRGVIHVTSVVVGLWAGRRTPAYV
ncbi:hypothetical protein [Burkholderia ubonensis]|uniref:Uncharacterized protein n=1 Tax=Burkholderia ubonensis subsp. mesacidophila TaxID=265293 RepID=A0A2A4FB32_9BURK|nr:hypothetical protein [Burkholderia ubonensis]PCE30355.1 hypothetical protein BZL54_21935 [Burkholderia ubonensis subsp. mesacidophila]